MISAEALRQRPVLILLLAAALCLTMIGTASAQSFPETIPLPDGFQPEGIASGRENIFFVGSIPTGAIYRGNIKTGAGEVLVPGQDGRAAIGLKFDRRTDLLFVAGGPTGYAFVYDARTGEDVAQIQLTAEETFVNDVVITPRAAYFTDSFRPVIYRVPLRENGQLAGRTPEEITLGGDFEFIQGAFNANGIAAARNGNILIIVNSTNGALYRVNPQTGDATQIDLGADSLLNGDGILLRDDRLYVVQNQLNQVAVVKLGSGFRKGSVAQIITSPLFQVPSTIARFEGRLYVVNAQFGLPDTEYEIVRVPDPEN